MSENYLKKELYQIIKTDEKIFDFIQDSALDGLWYWDLENPENEWMNPKFWIVLGYDPAEMPHKSSAWQSIINQDDLKVAIENFNKHCANPNHPYDQIVRYKHKKGSTVWIRCRGMAIRDGNGKPVRMLGAHHDVTETKQAEFEAKESRERLDAIINESPFPISIVDLNDEKILFLSRSFIELVGHAPKNVAEWYELAYPDPQYREDVVKRWKPVLEKAKKSEGAVNAGEYDITCKDGTVITCELHAHFLEDRLIVSLNNVSERKIAEHALKERNFLLNEIGKIVKVGGWKLDLQTNKLTWTKETYRIHDLDEDFEPTVERAVEFYDKESIPIITNALNKAIETGKEFDEDLHIITAKKIRKAVKAKGIAIQNDNGKVVELIGVFQDITKQKQADEALKESEKRYRKLIETIQEGIWQIDKDNNTAYVNQKMADIFGYTPEEMLGRNLFSFMDEQGITLAKDLLDKRRRGIEEQHDFEFITKTGDRVYLLLETVPLLDEKGNYAGALAASMDITDRKKAEEALKESEKRYRKLFNFLPFGISLTDKEGNLIENNEEAKKILGLDEEELLKRRISGKEWIIIRPDGSILPAEDYASVIALQENRRVDNVIMGIVKPGSETTWISVTAEPFQLGDYGVVISYLDITELISAEQKIRRSEEKFKAIFEQSAVGLIVADKNGRFLEVNKKLCDMFGYTEDEMLTKSANDIIYPEDIGKETPVTNKFLSGKKEEKITERKYISKDGDIIHGLMYTYIIQSKNDKNDYVIGALIDITHLKEIEKELRELNDTKDKFFSVISHDLKGPLSGIMSLSERFIHSYDDLPFTEMIKIITAIYNSSKNLSKLLENLLQWARINQGSIEFAPMTLTLRDFGDEAIMLLSESMSKKSIICGNNITRDIQVYVDDNMTQLIFRNLISNSIKFTNPGGSIGIDAREVKDNFVEISISDDGIGMSEQKIKHLFKIDKVSSSGGTEGEKGTGLGLILCKEFINKHGGQIWVESKEGEGSTFKFTLPMVGGQDRKSQK